MKLQIGIPDYPWEGGELATASLKGRLPQKPVPVLVMKLDELMERRKRLKFVHGCPTAVAVDLKLKKLWTFPTPNGAYELITVEAGGEPGVTEPPFPEGASQPKPGVRDMVTSFLETKKDGVPKPAKARGS